MVKGIGATQSTQSSRGSVGVSPTGIELGINVGIGQLGISTDYGGGIVIGFGGQKIVWGREGGIIHYNLGGFEVIIEARDCVVVETRKIAGMTVGTHTYPDPGCKLPEPEPEPKPEPKPNPDPKDSNASLLPDTDELMWVVCTLYEEQWYNTFGDTRLDFKATAIRLVTEKEKPVSSARTPFNIIETYVGSQYITSLFVHKITKNKTPRYRKELVTLADGDSASVTAIVSDSFSFDGGAHFTPTLEGDTDFGRSLCFYGQSQEIKKYITYTRKAKEEWMGTNGLSSRTFRLYSITDIIPLHEKKIRLLPRAGNQPPMPESCCESLKADIEDIKEVLATKEILAGKMTFPWELRMPGGQGEEVIMDYPNLARAIAQMIDHLGIHPPKLSIKDINNAIAGDQSINNQFPSATQGFEALMAQVWDANADVDTLTNFLYRLSWLNVQQSVNMAKMSAKVECLFDMLGGQTEPSETTLTVPFNIGAGVEEKKTTKGQGFGKNAKKEKGNSINGKIDANTEIATESLLPDFLQVRDNPIVIERFSGGTDINDKLDMLLMMIESLRRGQ